MGDTEEVIEKSFKDHVTQVIVACANIYHDKYVKYDYLVCSDAFEDSMCQEIKAEKDNYLHLLGVNTNLSAADFFSKCLGGNLTEEDFDFVKMGQSEKSVKGSVRQKVKVLPGMLNMLDKALLAEKKFKKNRISCFFAAADAEFTIGFVETGRPKSLMRKIS